VPRQTGRLTALHNTTLTFSWNSPMVKQSFINVSRFGSPLQPVTGSVLLYFLLLLWFRIVQASRDVNLEEAWKRAGRIYFHQVHRPYNQIVHLIIILGRIKQTAWPPSAGLSPSLSHTNTRGRVHSPMPIALKPSTNSMNQGFCLTLQQLLSHSRNPRNFPVPGRFYSLLRSQEVVNDQYADLEGTKPNPSSLCGIDEGGVGVRTLIRSRIFSSSRVPYPLTGLFVLGI
jgi:hypothetical protein